MEYIALLRNVPIVDVLRQQRKILQTMSVLIGVFTVNAVVEEEQALTVSVTVDILWRQRGVKNARRKAHTR